MEIEEKKLIKGGEFIIKENGPNDIFTPEEAAAHLECPPPL